MDNKKFKMKNECLAVEKKGIQIEKAFLEV